MKKHTIFYSWQSDLDSKITRNFIHSSLEKATRLATRGNVEERPSIDSDTKGLAGSPAITQSIMDKIEKASIVVADVSIVGRIKPSLFNRGRPSPNPNVLFELGYAVKCHGWERVIMVMNTNYGKPDELPFDLNSQRVFPYGLSKNLRDKSNIRKEYAKVLSKQFQAIFDIIDSARITLPEEPNSYRSAVHPVDISPLALKVATWISNKSEYGLRKEFFFSVNEIYSDLDISEESIELAITELLHKHFIGKQPEISGGQGKEYYPDHFLYFYLDSIIQNWNVIEDVSETIKWVKSEGMLGKDIHIDLIVDKYGWYRRRINPMLTYLEAKKLILPGPSADNYRFTNFIIPKESEYYVNEYLQMAAP